MKRINITRLATAAGIAGALAIASAAPAADQPARAPAVTNPASLMKFDNVRVVNATPEQLAAAQKSLAAREGMKAYVDANGLLRPVTQADVNTEASQPAAPVAARTAAAASTPETITTAKGLQMQATTPEDMAFAVAVVGKDGKLKQMCVEGEAGDKAALAKAEAANEVDTHEK